MSVFAEFFVAIASALLEATVWLAVLAFKPLRFLVSGAYREQVRAGWAHNRAQQIFDLLGGTTVLVLFTAAALWWMFAFLKQPSPEERRWTRKLEKAEQILRRAQDEIKTRRRKSEDHR